MFALTKPACFVLFDSTKQAVLEKWGLAFPRWALPASLCAINIDKEREPSPRHRLLKANFIVGRLVCVCVYAGMCALAYHCLLQKLLWSARFSLGRAAWQTPRSKQDNRWQYANGADSLFCSNKLRLTKDTSHLQHLHHISHFAAPPLPPLPD